MTAFKIEVKDSGVTAALNRLAASARDPSPALKAIGKALVPQIRKTFETSTDPWGRRWAPNSDATLRAMLHRGAGNFKKRNGALTVKADRKLAGKKPLIDIGTLMRQNDHKLEGGALVIYNTMKYAAMQQFGGKKSEFPNLWGDIPARPFMPITQAGELAPQAQREVIETIQEYLLRAVGQ